ncbi:hypothetical protein [Virgisporangium aurantiacum]|uniref:Uncharacterized protein n=1 Tax=Virgisporangium aurantiacum TaxID=175570 RepID=A0A8J3Z2F7_9ACTN|nr:hypothetical protein [Virgisporangium aurantiacum]GIJ56191.1 hypothetical protein Vau01_037070 [Virgisporangium aurantiacum]
MNFTDRINHAHDTLIDGTDPDGLDVRQALLLADRAATVANYATDTAAGWDQYALSIADAIEHLDAPLAAGWILAADIHPTPADVDRLAEPVQALVQRLADVLAAAATGDTDSPWRRLVWAQVAHRLDDARKDLP